MQVKHDALNALLTECAVERGAVIDLPRLPGDDGCGEI
jgi:hypothetical protein